MAATRIRCQVVEVPVFDELAPQEEGTWPRDLLPWADPYIASLMTQLDNRRFATEGLLDDEVTLYRCVSDLWQDDEQPQPALPPDRTGVFFDPPFPPIYGGFPLLEDRS